MPGRSRLIPAHAGKTAFMVSVLSVFGAHPRSRGENSSEASKACVAGGSSPLTRGKPYRSGPTSCGRRLIPAHAGKTASVSILPSHASAHPRSRGENPLTKSPMIARTGSSPLTRGKQQTIRVPVLPCGLIPAHAGKTCIQFEE